MKLIRVKTGRSITIYISRCGCWKVLAFHRQRMYKVRYGEFKATGKTLQEAAAKLILTGYAMIQDGEELSKAALKDFKLKGVQLGSVLNPPGIIGERGPRGLTFWHELYEATDGLKNIVEEKGIRDFPSLASGGQRSGAEPRPGATRRGNFYDKGSCE